jgi:hypothetical protein
MGRKGLLGVMNSPFELSLQLRIGLFLTQS